MAGRLDGRLSQAQVGDDVEVRDERWLLVHGHQSTPARLRGGVGCARLTSDKDMTGVRPDRAGKDLDQRALAGTVRAQERVDLPGHDGQNAARSAITAP